MDQRLRIVLKRICREIGWNCAEAWAVDQSDGHIRMLANWHDGSPLMTDFADRSEHLEFAPGTGMPGRVIHFQKAEILENIQSVPDTVFTRQDEARAAGITSAIGVPVGTNHRTYAALLFFRVDEPMNAGDASAVAKKSAEALDMFPRNVESRRPMPNHPLLRKLARFTDISPDDAGALLACFGPSREYAPGESLRVFGGGESKTVIIQSGWACVQRLLPDGGRQITHILLPGDMIGLVVEDPRDYGQEIRAITPVTAHVSPLSNLDALFRSRPAVASALYWMSLWEQSFLAARLTDIGRRSAFDRVAHLALDVYQRAAFLGCPTTDEIDWPLTQETLADALGLSTVHVNRTLRKLRADGFLESARGKLRFLDLEGLAETVGFEGTELYTYRTPSAVRVA